MSKAIVHIQYKQNQYQNSKLFWISLFSYPGTELSALKCLQQLVEPPASDNGLYLNK